MQGISLKTFIKIEQCALPFCEIHAAQRTKEIEALAARIENFSLSGASFCFSGWDGDFVLRLKPGDVYRIYSYNKKVYVETKDASYLFKYRMYEAEELLEKESLESFVRISNTEIINFDNCLKMDLSLTGVISVLMNNGKRSVVSRRYMDKVRRRLCLDK